MAACALLLTPMAMAADSAVHELPYDSYVFSADGTPLELPAPFVPQQIVTGAGLGVGGFQGLSDIFCGSDGLLVLADAGNNRLILTDTAWNAPVVLASFDNGGRQDAFNNPTGVYVRGNDLYVADAGNARILLFDRATLTLRRELSRPSIPSLGEDYTYKPLKLTADAAGRVYVVAEGINQGLIELNETGAFSTFLGAPSVTPDFFELIWRKFATKEQLAQLEKYVPTEYDAVTIDSDGFLFAVSKNAENTPIAKLNNQGNNVLLFPQKLGDAEFYENKPYFTDLALDERGIVFLLDSKQGKIYAYTQRVICCSPSAPTPPSRAASTPPAPWSWRAACSTSATATRTPSPSWSQRPSAPPWWMPLFWRNRAATRTPTPIGGRCRAAAPITRPPRWASPRKKSARAATQTPCPA